jgi:imidazole glycerol-phosphate synthase subunit HisH
MNDWVTIIDYGMGNIGSLRNMFRRIGVPVEVASDASTIARARKLLLPGVGAFDAAMERINAAGLAEIIRKRAIEDAVPTLGICLGMQLLTNGSEEGRLPGLGLVPAHTRRFPSEMGLKVPHMGWNLVSRSAPSPLTAGFAGETRFYFVHSYYVAAEQATDVILRCDYGVAFDAAIQRGNVYGAQFHPEKSHSFGMAFLKAFSDLPC